MNKEALLKTHWGFDGFKPLQEQIIDSVLSNNDTIALLPTGGGKSICYQIPALIRKGFVLVISPLIALIEDQVNELKSIGIKSMYFESNPNSISLSHQLDNAIHGNYKVIYVSPERLSNPFFTYLYRLIHPDLGLAIGKYLSQKNKLISGTEDLKFKGEHNEWLIQYSLKRLSKEHIDYFVFGHRHLPIVHQLKSKSKYINLGDWITHYTYGVFDGKTFTLRNFLKK